MKDKYENPFINNEDGEGKKHTVPTTEGDQNSVVSSEPVVSGEDSGFEQMPVEGIYASQNNELPEPPARQENVNEFKWAGQSYNEPPAAPKKKRSGFKVLLVTILIILSIGTVAFAGYGAYDLLRGDGSENIFASSTVSSQDNSSSGGGIILKDIPGSASGDQNSKSDELTIAEVYTAVSPSIVSIGVYEDGITLISEASGIVVTSDGYIITNEHVVTGAPDFIQVTLSNGTEYEATIVRTDARTDLAVIKVDAKGLSAAVLGDSTQIVVGEWVVAIGNPGGSDLAGSITQGIVSGVDRTIATNNGATITAIQTSAAINPGNSGGALVNMYGQVVGINSAKIADVNYEGIGFAIPTQAAQPNINDLINHGYVTDRVYLGVQVSDISQIMQEKYELPQGIQIVTIDSEREFYKQGARPDDIIVSIGGVDVVSVQSFLNQLSDYKPGQSTTIRVYRLSEDETSGEYIDVTLVLEADEG